MFHLGVHQQQQCVLYVRLYGVHLFACHSFEHSRKPRHESFASEFLSHVKDATKSGVRLEIYERFWSYPWRCEHQINAIMLTLTPFACKSCAVVCLDGRQEHHSSGARPQTE